MDVEYWEVLATSGAWQRANKWAIHSHHSSKDEVSELCDFLAKEAARLFDREIRGAATLSVKDANGEVVARYRVWRKVPDDFWSPAPPGEVPWAVRYTGLEGKLQIEHIEEQ